jgi:hypothetical protein
VLSSAGIPVSVAHTFLMQQYAAQVLYHVPLNVALSPGAMDSVASAVPNFDTQRLLEFGQQWAESSKMPVDFSSTEPQHPLESVSHSSSFQTITSTAWDGPNCEGPFNEARGPLLIIESSDFDDGKFRHRKPWRRLRGKRGYTTYCCQSCGTKWRVRSGDGEAEDQLPLCLLSDL